ncbi:phage portal protein [Thermosediminibacter oceani]|uniref:Bacteriophage portal protein, SPP1 Gp6 n=1 Tax=Thermosediminibacter oceani (strain ATCC BAA-1034 / DSM 16646 / JW/IW-1228P) TaxID=555079 RepID=D9S2Y6_THEOJ|nr:phage portal protein [Thermosediminibacter oceani]ADL07763.1 Bacteriophage portal protein, SPP1 Gp6 [Thermosediminibacter oceani DSM 16646]
MDIREYVEKYYPNSKFWFTDEVKQLYHQSRIKEVLDIKEYLSGKHKILNRQEEVWNGKKYYPRIIILNYAKTILNFATSYLLKNPVTLTGNENVVSKFQKIYKKGDYYRLDFDILDKMQKYGTVYEYVYVDDEGTIRSKIIDPADGYPVIGPQNEYLAFVEYYVVDGVSYYTVFYDDRVEEYTDEGGTLHLVNKAENISGLPIIYKNQNELDPNFGRSDLLDYVNIIDNMEDLLSKFSDTVYKHHNPIPVAIGQKLTSGGIDANLVGNGINLDTDSDFKLVSGNLNHQAVKMLYDTLRQALLDISCTPAVSLNSVDISNLSEVSIKLLFSLAEIKAGLNAKYMSEGIQKRLEVFRRILALNGENISDEEMESVNVVFTTARPMNEKDIIDNLKTLRGIGAISLETMIEQNPYVNDTIQEIERLNNEKMNVNRNDSQ